jgi:hypothetical protein
MRASTNAVQLGLGAAAVGGMVNLWGSYLIFVRIAVR